MAEQRDAHRGARSQTACRVLSPPGPTEPKKNPDVTNFQQMVDGIESIARTHAHRATERESDCRIRAAQRFPGDRIREQ